MHKAGGAGCGGLGGAQVVGIVAVVVGGAVLAQPGQVVEAVIVGRPGPAVARLADGVAQRIVAAALAAAAGYGGNAVGGRVDAIGVGGPGPGV